MPTVFRHGPYRFYFFAGDRNEPAHIHVERDDSEAKFWLIPVRLTANHGFGRQELRRIERIILQHQRRLVGEWNEYFNQ